MKKNIKVSNLKSEKKGSSYNRKNVLSESLRENLKKRKIQAKNRKQHSKYM